MNNVQTVNEIGSNLDSIKEEIKMIDEDFVTELRKGKLGEDQVTSIFERIQMSVTSIINNAARLQKALDERDV